MLCTTSTRLVARAVVESRNGARVCLPLAQPSHCSHLLADPMSTPDARQFLTEEFESGVTDVTELKVPNVRLGTRTRVTRLDTSACAFAPLFTGHHRCHVELEQTLANTFADCPRRSLLTHNTPVTCECDRCDVLRKARNREEAAAKLRDVPHVLENTLAWALWSRNQHFDVAASDRFDDAIVGRQGVP